MKAPQKKFHPTAHSPLTVPGDPVITLFPPKRQYLLLVLAFFAGLIASAEPFRLASYNLERYTLTTNGYGSPKTAQAKAQVQENILLIRPHVLALQEIGTTNALLELRDALAKKGLQYPHWDHVSGFDTNIFVAVLSQYPIVRRQPHTNDGFLLFGRRFQTSRGISELDIEINPGTRFTLFTAHLKSKRPISVANEADLREEEAKLLRHWVDQRLESDPAANLALVGDFNDTPGSVPIRTLIGRGKHKLVDTRPAERNGDPDPAGVRGARNVTWTHFYSAEDSYSRFDYIRLSRAMAAHWVPEETYVLARANWGAASDHRPIVATFQFD